MQTRSSANKIKRDHQIGLDENPRRVTSFSFEQTKNNRSTVLSSQLAFLITTQIKLIAMISLFGSFTCTDDRF